MRSCPFVLTAAFLAATAGLASAQADRPFTPLELAAGCAPPPAFGGAPDGAPRVIGSQDTIAKRLLGARDLLVVDSGTKAGIQLGQQFFVRRPSSFGMGPYGRERERGSTTLGWIRIVAVNESTAIASVDQMCGGIIAGDYLVPFVAPVLPSDADRDERAGEPDFTSLARIVIGNEDRLSAGAGDFMLIDRGSSQGLTAGARFSVYRDLRVDGAPLSNIGEGIVIATGESVAVTRITRARDAVISGDYVAIRK
jgi:hypothetical protein